MGFNFRQQNILNPYAWTVGSGGFTGFGQNGQTVENERVNATDPFGNTSVVWETRPTSDSGGDGGWDTTSFTVDSTKLYRFSVWVKRTSATGGGTFYLGYGGTVLTLGGASEGNPYWECVNTGWLTQNQWFLAVGHIFPEGYSGGIKHPNSGYWTVGGGKYSNLNTCNIGYDCKFVAGTTSAYHRVYHYYCTDNTTHLQFFEPKVELCDGTEMSMTELLTASGNTLASASITPEGASRSHQKVVATGGDAITTNGEWRIHRFNGTGTFTVTSYIGEALTVDYLIVGGGGGGGLDMGGGGGGGGVIYRTSMPLYAGAYTATVGGGGAGGPAGCSGSQPCDHQFTISAANGTNSSFNGETAYGGGFGGSSYYGYTPNYGTAGSGGCGGGPSGYSAGGTIAGAAGVSGQGYAGGGGGPQYYSGGGGGAGAVGTSSTSKPTGGAGFFCGILGRPFYWGGGGGGASYSMDPGGDGGKGGGGGGAVGFTSGGTQSVNWGVYGGGGAPASWAQSPGGNGGANSGGGGGGGSHYNRTNQGGNGGSGIVVIRYKYK